MVQVYTPPPSMPRVPTLATCLALALPAAAQGPEAWQGLQRPTNIVPGQVSQRGKVCVYEENGAVYAWSALTRTWTQASRPASGTLQFANDLAWILGKSELLVFCSLTGRFQRRSVSSGAQVLNSPAQRNDAILLVQDGNQVLSYSAFDGQLRTLNVAGPVQAAVARHTAVLSDGQSLWGMSAFGARWVPQPVGAGVGSLAAAGSTGLARDNTSQYAFSSIRESWAQTTRPGATAQQVLDHDLAVWHDAFACLGYSAQRGSFSQQITATAVTVKSAEQLAVAQNGGRIWCYSAMLGTWTSAKLGGAPQVDLGGSVALIRDGFALTAYSPLTGGLSGITLNYAQVDLSTAVALVVGNQGGGKLFSALRGSWTDLPRNTNNVPVLSSSGALVPTGQGLLAWSARSGNFFAAPGGTTVSLLSNRDSAILARETAGELQCFDVHREAWLRQPIAGRLQTGAWRMTLCAHDGQRAYGFSPMHGQIHSIALPGTPQELSASSESARIVLGTGLHCFSTVPLVSTPWQFPEFRRHFSTGAELDLYLAPRELAQVWVALSLQQPFRLPGLGDVLLDGSTLLPLVLPLDGRSNPGRLRLPVPEVGGVHGVEVFFQGLVIPSTGQPYITGVSSLTL